MFLGRPGGCVSAGEQQAAQVPVRLPAPALRCRKRMCPGLVGCLREQFVQQALGLCDVRGQGPVEQHQFAALDEEGRKVLDLEIVHPLTA